MNNRELSIQITLGGFSFRIGSLDSVGELLAHGSLLGYDFDADWRIAQGGFEGCFCEWSVPQVLIIPRPLFDQSIADRYLIGAGIIDDFYLGSYRVMWQVGESYAAVWSVATPLAECVEGRFVRVVHSHPLLDLLESNVAERECVKVVVDSFFVAHIAIWDHRGLVVAESVQLTSDEDLLYYVRRFSVSDPFMVYRVELRGHISSSLEALISDYYMATDVLHAPSLL